tara:strand:+ start:383852 stop:385702 length:1851 start_codon:yes stop_codon:yes gene_type:complete
MMKKLLTVLTLAMTLSNPLAARAADTPVVPIQQLKTPAGISVWLVESHTLPMVSVEVAFNAGSMYDPQGKEGVASMTAAMLTQGGAGGLSSEQFLKQTERLGAGIAADADTQVLSVGLQSLSENIEASFSHFAEVINNPDFNKKDFERVKQALLASRKRIQENPGKLADEAFDQLVFGRYHPYAHSVIGTDYSLPALTRKDVEDYYEKMFGRKNMVVSIVGDITPEKAVELVEKHFAKLPKGRTYNIPEAPQEQPPVLQKITLPVPQTSIIMGHKGISRQNPDYFATLLMNHIFGSGGFSSILMEEVREKRGLAYGIYSYFEPLPHWGAFQVSVKTKNESAFEVVDLVKAEIEKLKENGVSDEAYQEAMDYMIGSFPLRLDSNADILTYLTFMQTENMGADYLDKWLDNMRKVTRDDIHRVAKKYLKPDDMVVVMVGQPGVASKPQKTATPVKQKPEAAAPKAVPAAAVATKAVAEPAAPAPVTTAPAPTPKPVAVAPKVAPAPVSQPIPEDVLVEEESVSAGVSNVSSTAPAKAAPVTVVPNPNAGKIIIPDDPEKLRAAEERAERKAEERRKKAAPVATKSSSTPKISATDSRQLKDAKVKPRTRRNVDADEWL